MADREASHTALATAYLRAAHQLLDAPPRILDDPIAVRLLGNAAPQKIHDEIERYQSAPARALRSHVVLRSRYTEDCLQAAQQRGITQYIILGAGFDTFALRQPAWAKSLKIFEVDHPGTQALKRSHLAAAALEMPANLAFAQIDFEHESLLDGLLRHGVSLDEPTLFSWLGVTMYLNEAAIDSALLSVAAFPSGSEIVLTFLQPPESASDAAPAQLAGRVAGAGEPFVSYFEPEAMAEKLTGAGFTKLEFLSPEDADTKYYKHRPTDLPVPRRTGIVSAIR
ncbi:MAG: class I SAM-dependent methyltransferase [Proteobacteria bacterium]|nr:class I SAM-dependent methyltransferase [Pseudomonadota bacterium]